MSATTQLIIFSIFASVVFLILLTTSEAILSKKSELQSLQLSVSRAKLEEAFYHLAYCGEACYLTVELPMNVSLEISNQTCIIGDQEGRFENCYFPFVVSDTNLVGSSFMLSLNATELEVISLG